MKILAASAAVVFCSITVFSPSSFTEKFIDDKPANVVAKADPKIQVAILLDVSGSMDGLIEQAKVQLWNMASVMGKVKCDNGNPKIEIALYEYGRTTNDEKAGYVKQISGFTSDLDLLSQELFKLKTNGGDEYCGHVIHSSLNELTWDSSLSNYKVIFIAGNEDFLQGGISYTQSCAEARKKGVIVNTIYCGSKEMAIREHWNLGGECGGGSFTVIDQEVKTEEIPTPYDSTLIVLNNRLNGTYIFYGDGRGKRSATQARVDELNFNLGMSVAAKRIAAKSNGWARRNGGFDFGMAVAEDSSILRKVDRKTLPDSLENKSPEELKKIVIEKNLERERIQKEIQIVSTNRDNYIATEQAKKATNKKASTLETEIEKIIRSQVGRFNMKVD